MDNKKELHLCWVFDNLYRTIQIAIATMNIPASEPTSETYQCFLYAYNFFSEELFDNSLPKVLFTYQRKNKTMGYASSKRWIDTNGAFIDELAMNPEYFARYAMIEIFDTLVHEACHIWQFHYGKQSRKGYHNKDWGDKMESIGLYPSSTGRPGGNKTGQRMSDYIIKDGPFIKSCAKLKQQQFSIPFKDRFPVLRRHHNVYAFDEDGLAYLIDEDYQTNGPALSLMPQNTVSNIDNTLVDTDENLPIISDVDEPVIIEPTSPFTNYEGYTEALEEGLSVKPQSQRTKNNSKTKYTCPSCKTNIWGKPNLKVACVSCDKPFSCQT